ncbi:MAG: hypothetical protein ACRD0D_09430, partial [Acidimicrobiales bacterium]
MRRNDLEDRLRAAFQRAGDEFHPSPGLRGRVDARLAPRPPRRPLAVTVAVVAALAAGGLLVSRGEGDADLVTIEPAPAAVSPPPTVTTTTHTTPTTAPHAPTAVAPAPIVLPPAPRGAADVSRWSVFHATKVEGQSILYRQPAAGGPAEVVFTYDDGEAADHRPIAAVAPDGRSVAFARVHGVFVADLATGHERALATARPLHGSDHPPLVWSVPAMNGTGEGAHFDTVHLVDGLNWSADGRYLLVSVHYWENRGTGVFDVASGRYTRLPNSGDAVVARDRLRVALAGSHHASPGRVMVSSVNDLTEFTELVPSPDSAHTTDYDDIAISPGGDRLAFTFEHLGGTDAVLHHRSLGVVNVDGSGYKVLDDGADKSSPAFVADGTGLVWIELHPGVVALARYDLR